MLNFAANAIGGYNLTRSLRFRSSASAYLNRTMTTATDAKKWTWSGWVKRGAFSQAGLIASGNLTTDGSGITFVYGTGASLCFYDYISSTFTTNLVSTQVFRDPAAWYHIVVAVDTTQATASNRVKMYVNGTQITSFSAATYPALNSTGYMNSGTYATTIGREGGFGNYYDGYLTEVNFIDGQALTPSSFGSYNSVSGVWQPAPYTGTYGTNGFYLPFTDNSALTTSSNVGLGKDFSGNGNYWTTNNISITSGTTYDSMTDVPTLTSATAANFAVMNPVNTTTQLTFSNANLATTYASGTWNLSRATIGVSSGSWYWEVTAGGANNNFIGIANSAAGVYDALGVNSNSAGWNFGGSFFYNGTSVNFAVVWTTGDVIGVAFNATTNVITFYKNGVVVNSGGTATAVTGGLYFPANSQSAGTFNVNFGQRPFSYTPPTGFKALNTYNLPTGTILKGNTVMDATLYTGTLLSNPVINTTSFKSDLVWIKSRSAATDHKLTDSVRGVTKALTTNSTNNETTDTQGLTAFNSNGFTVGTDTNYNNLSATYVGWQWQAGQGTTSTNTNGTITSTVSVNASAGFSVVTFTTPSGYTTATVGHSLGVAPSMYIVKNRNGTVINWNTYHQSLGNTQALYMNLTNAAVTSSTFWNNTSPTSSVFSIGANLYANQDYIAYCWAPVPGYSAFGSYTGNGSTDGTFVYTGFRPKWIMIKEITSGGTNWNILDTSRDPYNVEQKYLAANLFDAEGTLALLDGLSNGFKLRSSGLAVNASGSTYIYMAFAENPFKNALAR